MLHHSGEGCDGLLYIVVPAPPESTVDKTDLLSEEESHLPELAKNAKRPADDPQPGLRSRGRPARTGGACLQLMERGAWDKLDDLHHQLVADVLIPCSSVGRASGC